MKKVVIYVVLLFLALMMPVRGTDVGKLIPVELLRIDKEEESVIIMTDLGVSGTGATVEAAIENLKLTAAGVIFLDTADYLIIDDGARQEGTALEEHLNPSVRVCISDGEIDMEMAAAYLDTHEPKTKLRDYDSSGTYEILTTENGKMILKEN